MRVWLSYCRVIVQVPNTAIRHTAAIAAIWRSHGLRVSAGT